MVRRLLVAVTLLVVALVGSGGLGRGVGAQDATPIASVSLDGHPLVGAWILDTDTADDENPPTLVEFTSDGIYVQHDPDGANGVGTWEATGPTTARLTFLGYFFVDDQGTIGGTMVRAEIEASADGQNLTAIYTLEVLDPAGPFGQQYGPGMVSGQRIAVEPMGTPVGPLDDAFGGTED